MKKIFTLLFCLASLGASAQQVNGGFDETWVNCVPWTSANNTTKVGTQPQDWCISNVKTTVTVEVGSQESTGQGDASPNYSVNLTNVKSGINLGLVNLEQQVPAYMTLGTAWSTAKVSLLSGISAADGGVFGGISFTNKPDGIKLYYKRSHGSANATEKASVIAYLWKGTWTQESVPGNIAVKGSPTTCTMTNRERNILGKTTTTGGTITKSNDAECIATIEEYISGDASEWTEFTTYFNYTSENTPQYLNIILAANDYFADRSTIGKGNSFTVDNVELIYNSSLSGLEFNKEPVDGFAKDNYNYYVVGNYTEGCIDYTKDCVGGSATGSWDEETGVYTITVKGDDWSVTNRNEHIYTVTFIDVDLIINDGDDITNVPTITSGKIMLNRKFKAGWNTLCLPFSFRKANISGVGASGVYELKTSTTGETIEFTSITGTIAAHQPCLVYFDNEVNSITFTSKTTVSGNPGTESNGTWNFTGSYAPSMSMENKWGVVNEGGKVRKGNSTSTLKSTRAYFTYTGTANVNEMRFIIDDELTHITEIDGEPTHFDVYNMQGVLVRKNATSLEGLRKGIYIVNGKKRIIK